MAATPTRSNSVLNLLNPYSSLSRSALPNRDRDSPSTAFLRELQGDDTQLEIESGSPDRDRMSPTPIPTHRRGQEVFHTPVISSEDEEEDTPPRSILYGAREGNMPESPSKALVSVSDPIGEVPLLQYGPPSSSASASTSPGPSTISVFASGIDVDTSTSPEQAPPPRPVPTFRELPRPAQSARRTSGSGHQPRGQYLDPPALAPSDRKGKGKALSRGRRKNHAVFKDEDEDEAVHRGRNAGLGVWREGGRRKTGLDDYEHALWKWVNVDDLDGFLQDVSHLILHHWADLSYAKAHVPPQVYAYYKGKGIYCIALARVLNLLYGSPPVWE